VLPSFRGPQRHTPSASSGLSYTSYDPASGQSVESTSPSSTSSEEGGLSDFASIGEGFSSPPALEGGYASSPSHAGRQQLPSLPASLGPPPAPFSSMLIKIVHRIITDQTIGAAIPPVISTPGSPPMEERTSLDSLAGMLLGFVVVNFWLTIHSHRRIGCRCRRLGAGYVDPPHSQCF
jgi:hypothetical protein